MRRVILGSVLAIVTLGLLWHVGCTTTAESHAPGRSAETKDDVSPADVSQAIGTLHSLHRSTPSDPEVPGLDLQAVIQQDETGSLQDSLGLADAHVSQEPLPPAPLLGDIPVLTDRAREVLNIEPMTGLPPPRQENTINGMPLEAYRNRVALETLRHVDVAIEALKGDDVERARDAVLLAQLELVAGREWLNTDEFEGLRGEIEGVQAELVAAPSRPDERRSAVMRDNVRKTAIRDVLDRARAQQNQQDYDAALESVEEALFIDPSNAPALLLRDIYSGAIEFQSHRELQRATESAYAEAETINDAELINFPAGWTEQRLAQASRQMAEQMAGFSGATPSLDEEVWVIAKPDDWDAQLDDAPGCGALLTSMPDHDEPVPVPLEHTNVNADVAGHIASTVVTQTFNNPFEVTIEATYVFPLPERAAVNEFVMQIGERRIRGIIRERAEAERIYAQARAAGHTASLLTQERPNIFTQKVANIEPGREIDIEITYFHTLPYRDGSFEYVFPMVVGPRFNPPHTTDGIGAVARDATGSSGQSVEVAYLAPHERSGHDVAIELRIDAGVEVGEVRSKHHAVAVRRDSPTGATVKLASESTIANKDFVLRYDVAGEDVRTAMVTTTDPISGERYFSMLIVPPHLPEGLERRPMELVFVLDASGSMSGAPITQAKDAIAQALDMLQPQDTFQIIRFSENASSLGRTPLEATTENIALAKRHVSSIEGGGGTMMIEGIKAALDFPHDETRTRYVVFLTDGFIGNEFEILGEMRSRLGAARVFSFGVGSSPNRYLIERMAKLGHGAVAYLSLEDSGREVMSEFFERASRPAMTDVLIDWGAMQVADVNPPVLPDIYAGRPLTVTGRLIEGEGGEGQVRILGAGPVGHVELAPEIDNAPESLKAVRAIWARGRIAKLLDEATFEPARDLPSRVRDLALTHALMSPFTAFVAVDSTRLTSGPTDVSVTVPVSVPEGVSYDATVIRERK